MLADFLANGADVKNERFEITQLYASAMYRSLLTAQPLASALDLKPQVWVDLHEKGGMFLRREWQNQRLRWHEAVGDSSGVSRLRAAEND